MKKILTLMMLLGIVIGCQKQQYKGNILEESDTKEIKVKKDTVIVSFGNEDIIGKDSNVVYIHYFEKLFSDSHKGLDVDIIRDNEVHNSIASQFGEDVYNKLLDQHVIGGRAGYNEEDNTYYYEFAQRQSFGYNEGAIIYHANNYQLSVKLIVDGKEIDVLRHKENLIGREALRVKVKGDEFFCHGNGTKISLFSNDGEVVISNNIGYDSPYYLDTNVFVDFYNTKGKKLYNKQYKFERVNKGTISISLRDIPEEDAVSLMGSFVKWNKNLDQVLTDRAYGYTKVWYRLLLDPDSEEAAVLSTTYFVESCTYSNYYE